ncbi:MAG: hypothetical protein HOP11_14345 [Saprospiraceae bacterium]|nr:hypothetical protein [Saprospiraceae bacterium]
MKNKTLAIGSLLIGIVILLFAFNHKEDTKSCVIQPIYITESGKYKVTINPKDLPEDCKFIEIPLVVECASDPQDRNMKHINFYR